MLISVRCHEHSVPTQGATRTTRPSSLPPKYNKDTPSLPLPVSRRLPDALPEQPPASYPAMPETALHTPSQVYLIGWLQFLKPH